MHRWFYMLLMLALVGCGSTAETKILGTWHQTGQGLTDEVMFTADHVHHATERSIILCWAIDGTDMIIYPPAMANGRTAGRRWAMTWVDDTSLRLASGDDTLTFIRTNTNSELSTMGKQAVVDAALAQQTDAAGLCAQ